MIGAPQSELSFYHGFIAAASVIVVSELGDKTWFIAAIMAMRHSRLAVFLGAMAAQGVMTMLSACLGWMTQLIPRRLTFYVSTALFAIFGLKLLYEGWQMKPGEGQEEYEEANAEVQKCELDSESTRFLTLESGQSRENSSGGVCRILAFVSNIFLKSFTLTFLAEWGDRSQITTIILGARENVYGVIIGAIIGHAICTGIAVVGGRLLAQRISIRTVTLISGVVFLIFALSAIFIEESETSSAGIGDPFSFQNMFGGGNEGIDSHNELTNALTRSPYSVPQSGAPVKLEVGPSQIGA